MTQEKIWKQHAENVSVSDLARTYRNPALFQKELAALIGGISAEQGYKRIIEAGCGSGITSMLLSESVEKTFLDLDNTIIEKVKAACAELNIAGHFVVGDMFSIEYPDKSFDVVFNAGVIEHFDKQERTKALKEYARILKNDGTMIVALPNHHSFPYRSAYVLKKEILRGYKWRWPAEYKIYDLGDEIKSSGLILMERITMAKDTVFDAWRFLKPVMKMLQWSDLLFKYEGYLTVLIIKKQ